METAGKDLQGGDAETRRVAAAALGSARTPAKKAAASARAEKLKGIPLSDATRQKLSDKGKERWAAIRAAEASAPAVPKEKKRMGRPPKPVDPDAADAPKRGRGRPKKQDAQTSAQDG